MQFFGWRSRLGFFGGFHLGGWVKLQEAKLQHLQKEKQNVDEKRCQAEEERARLEEARRKADEALQIADEEHKRAEQERRGMSRDSPAGDQRMGATRKYRWQVELLLPVTSISPCRSCLLKTHLWDALFT